MKKLILAVAFMAALPLVASADVSKEDIKKLIAAGISEDVILTFIRAQGGAGKLSADDVVELKQAGATEKVLTALMGTSAPGAPAPRTQVVEKPVYVPQTTYVYDTTPSYSYYSSPSYYYPYAYSYPYYYSSCYPSYYYSSSCYPSYGFSYSRYGRSTSYGFRSGRCW